MIKYLRMALKTLKKNRMVTVDDKTFQHSLLQQISDDGIAGICRGCLQLQSLCVSGCTNLTDASLIALGLNCPRLKWVMFRYCINLLSWSCNNPFKNSKCLILFTDKKVIYNDTKSYGTIKTNKFYLTYIFTDCNHFFSYISTDRPWDGLCQVKFISL